jgi:isopentenyl diphosphate isomerase/L-lactate dehydrogenase-like FMN-dependent dehydrogenase
MRENFNHLTPVDSFISQRQRSAPDVLYAEPENIAALAKQRLSENGWFYSACNAGIGWAHNANRVAFYRHRIIPRILVDTNARDTATELFGHKLAAPIGFAPIGINRIYHPTGETSVAKVAQELNLAYALSSAGSYSIEEVGRMNGEGMSVLPIVPESR